MMNLAMIGALDNGVSAEKIRAIVHIVGNYCGVPQALKYFRAACKVLEEAGKL